MTRCRRDTRARVLAKDLVARTDYIDAFVDPVTARQLVADAIRQERARCRRAVRGAAMLGVPSNEFGRGHNAGVRWCLDALRALNRAPWEGE